MREPLGVAVVGFGWMGRVHTQAYARVLHHFPQLALVPQLVAVADPEAGRLDEAVDQYGFARAAASWQELAGDDDVHAVSITAPNYLHREIAAAMTHAGKHIWIEKPVGLDAADAQAVADDVLRTGVQSKVGFNYRNAPAVDYARTLIEQGRIGRPTHARFRLLSDYAAHPDGALTWRFERDRGGNGVLGDLVSHGIDLARHLLGDIESLVADTAVFIRQRPRATGAMSHFDTASGELGQVENEDYASCLLRLVSGARVTLEASRVSVGEQCNYGFEIHGTKGALYWDFRRMGELGVCAGDGYQDQMTSTVFVGPGQGHTLAFQPGAGIALGFDDLKVIEAAQFLQSISEGKPHGATIEDAVHSALALDAMVESARTGAWVEVPR